MAWRRFKKTYLRLSRAVMGLLDWRSWEGGKRAVCSGCLGLNQRAPAHLTSQINKVTSELFADVSQPGVRSLTPQQLEHTARLPPSLLRVSSELNQLPLFSTAPINLETYPHGYAAPPNSSPLRNTTPSPPLNRPSCNEQCRSQRTPPNRQVQPKRFHG